MYKFKRQKAVDRVMNERRGPDDRFVKGWGHRRTAPVICSLIRKHGLRSFVEVGACGCQLSEIVLIEFPNVRVWSVDRHFENIKNNQGKLTTAPIDRMKKQFGERFDAIQRHSPEVTEEFPDCSLDLVYIDAKHTYDAVRADIFAWWPKISKIGILSGHDYGHEANAGVSRAVDEIFRSVHTGDYHNWWIAKVEADLRVTL